MITASLAERGFQFVRSADMRQALEAAGPLSDWSRFAASWNDLVVDPYLAAGVRCRRRRFGVYSADADGAVQRQAHQPHFQGQEYNRLFGGIERWFEPIAAEVGDGA